MKIFLFAVVAASLISGCASINKQPLPNKTKTELQGQSVGQTKRPIPDFAALTPAKAATLLIGAALSISEGNSIIASNKVADPADAIGLGLAKEIELAFGAKSTAQQFEITENDVASIAIATGDKARFVMDVQTLVWRIGYFPTDWTHYRLTYTAKARLIDVATKTIVAEGFCIHNPDSNVGAPTYDELTGNGAVGLKKLLSVAVDACIKSFKVEMLTL
jgi:hypothetical protein